MRESELLQLIMDYLSAKRVFHWRVNTGATKIGDRFIRFGKKGVSDIIGIANDGRMIAIECKVGSNRPSLEQEEFIENVRKRGGIAIVAYSLDDVTALL